MSHTWRAEEAWAGEAMAGVCTSGTLAVLEDRGASGPMGTFWDAGDSPKVFLLNWIMKPSRVWAVSFWKRSWYTAHIRSAFSIALTDLSTACLILIFDMSNAHARTVSWDN